MSLAAGFALAVALAVVLGLASDRLPPHRVALGGFALLVLGGVLDSADTLNVVGSSGLVTVLCMFLIASALEHTGVVDEAVRRLMRVARTRPTAAWMLFFAAVLVGSMVVPNTPVVVLACPAALLLAQRTRTPSGRLLLPIAFLASLGGSVTLMGSSVNVVASDLLRDHDGSELGTAQLLAIGLPVALAGAAAMAVLARWLPPGRTPSAQLFAPAQRYLHELVIGPASPLLDRPLGETLLAAGEHELVELFAAERPAAGGAGPALATYRPQAGDRLLLRGAAEHLVAARQRERHGDAEMVSLEVWLPAYSRLAGLRVGELRLDSIYGIRLLGVAPLLGSLRDLAQHRLATGDRLLMDGPRAEVERFLASEAAFGPLQIERSRQARGKAPLALAALGFVVLAPASGWLALETAALCAAIGLAVGGVLRNGFQLPPLLLRTLGVLLGMLGIGAGLERSGATTAMVAPLIETAAALGPWPLLVAVYLCASLLSEVLTNNGVVVLLIPLALGLADSLGLPTLPFALAVLFGASASFATPIGYQTNTLVYQLGGYRFRDFLLVGLPLKLLVGAVALGMLALLYPM